MRYPLIFSVLTASFLTLGVANEARAACTNDVDCPTAACGGQVCDWPAQECMGANPSAQGTDGWCTTSTDCKCMGEGATCVGVHCTFTVPGGGGDGGAAATGADASVDASATPDDASEDATPTRTPTSSYATDSGGCSVAGAGARPVGGAARWASLLGLVVAAGLRKRTRR